MNPPLSYFCIGKSLSSLVNLETMGIPAPHVIPNYGGMPMSLQGQTAQRAASGRLRRNGSLVGRWHFDVFETYDQWRALRSLLLLADQQYITTSNANGYWTPYLCYLDMPFIGDSMNTTNWIPNKVTVNLFGAVLQYLNKTANYTVTTSDHLVILTNGATGDVTFTLPPIATVNAYVPYRFLNQSDHNLVLDANGSETINASPILTLSPPQILVDGDMEESGTTPWTALNSATLSKETGTPYQGSRVLKVARNGANNPAAAQYCLVVGRSYHLTGVVRSDGSSTPFISSATGLWTGTTSTDWQPFDFAFTADSTLIAFATSAGTDGQYANYDNLKLTVAGDVPTVATLIKSGGEWKTVNEHASGGTRLVAYS